jgi:uncharacterized membrane protein
MVLDPKLEEVQYGRLDGVWKLGLGREQYVRVLATRVIYINDLENADITLCHFALAAIWIIIGTTTFVSALLATLNSLSLQTQVARLLSDYLTRNTGFTVVFEEGMIKPRWADGRLRMGGVFISRRPIERSEGAEDEEEDEAAWRARNNYTMFDLNIEEVEVTLSLPKWFDGKGLVNEAKVKGVRGVIGKSLHR